MENENMITCIRCNTVNDTREGFYCHECGAPLVNHCTDDSCVNGAENSQIDLSYKMCPECGNKSTLHEAGII